MLLNKCSHYCSPWSWNLQTVTAEPVFRQSSSSHTFLLSQPTSSSRMLNVVPQSIPGSLWWQFPGCAKSATYSIGLHSFQNAHESKLQVVGANQKSLLVTFSRHSDAGANGVGCRPSATRKMSLEVPRNVLQCDIKQWVATHHTLGHNLPVGLQPSVWEMMR